MVNAKDLRFKGVRMYEIVETQRLSQYLGNSIRMRWDDEPFPGRWSVSYASTRSQWQWSESRLLSVDSLEHTWPYYAMLRHFELEEIENLCPPSIVFQRNPEELDCLDDVSSICMGMVRDLDRCFTEDEDGSAAWIGGSLLLFSYIEILGRMFLPQKRVAGPLATEAFVSVYMPDLAHAIETAYKESLHKNDQKDVYKRFHNHFRDGLAHQYFPKKGELGINEAETPIIHDTSYGRGAIVVIKHVLVEFRKAVQEFLTDVVEKKERQYGESLIDVNKNCAKRLEWWLEEETMRIIETIRKNKG